MIVNAILLVIFDIFAQMWFFALLLLNWPDVIARNEHNHVPLLWNGKRKTIDISLVFPAFKCESSKSGCLHNRLDGCGNVTVKCPVGQMEWANIIMKIMTWNGKTQCKQGEKIIKWKKNNNKWTK